MNFKTEALLYIRIVHIFPPRQFEQKQQGRNQILFSFAVLNLYRLPPLHGPQSPIQSPIYDQLGPYKTLPHVRSHSPFAAGLTLARIPRQGAGYVTIPRRPRQSWSSEPPPSSELIGEPLYDNLGIRTTADGE